MQRINCAPSAAKAGIYAMALSICLLMLIVLIMRIMLTMLIMLILL